MTMGNKRCKITIIPLHAVCEEGVFVVCRRLYSCKCAIFAEILYDYEAN